MLTIDRKFVVWDFATEDGRKVRIEVRYKQDREEGNSPITFYAKHEGDPSFSVENANLDELRREVLRLLDAANQVTWTPLLIVACGPTEPRDIRVVDSRWDFTPLSKDGLGLRVWAYEEGVAADGSRFHRYRAERSRGGKYWRVHKGVGLDVAAARTIGHLANHAGLAVVPDTPENREDLAGLALRLEELTNRLSADLNADDFAARLAAGAVLAPPAGGDGLAAATVAATAALALNRIHEHLNSRIAYYRACLAAPPAEQASQPQRRFEEGCLAALELALETLSRPAAQEKEEAPRPGRKKKGK